jgi:predicted RNase H-like HicB family nuclease
LTEEETMGYDDLTEFGIGMKTKAYFMMRLPFRVKKEGNMYISWCPALDVSSCGDTTREAERNLREALRLFIMSCYERGVLDKVLKDCGFVPGKPRASKARAASHRTEMWVPLPFVVDQALARCRA